jgi:hypothetical protein
MPRKKVLRQMAAKKENERGRVGDEGWTIGKKGA